MGECLIQVPIKVPLWLAQRLDSDVERFAPFCEGRSAVGREALIQFYLLVDAGIIEWNSEAVNRVRSNSQNGNRVHGIPSNPVSTVPRKGK